MSNRALLNASTLEELHRDVHDLASQVLANAFSKTVDARTTRDSTIQEVQNTAADIISNYVLIGLSETYK